MAGPGQRAALTTRLPTPQGNQMSIMFLEPGHAEPGRVHQGQLQLVEVSGAGGGPRPSEPSRAQKRPKGARTAVPARGQVAPEQDGSPHAGLQPRSRLGLPVPWPLFSRPWSLCG